MAGSETHALGCEPIDMRRWDFAALAIITLQVSISDVVGVEDNDVGLGCRRIQRLVLHDGQNGRGQREGFFHVEFAKEMRSRNDTQTMGVNFNFLHPGTVRSAGEPACP